MTDSRFDWEDRLIDIYRLHRAVLPPLPPAWSVGRNGAKVELVEPLTPMALLNLLWAERQAALISPGLDGEVIDSNHTDSDSVHLRPMRREDSSLIYQWLTDRELMIMTSPDSAVSDIDHDAWVESMLVRRNDLVIFIIEDETGKPVGACQLVNIKWVHRSAELQIRIAPSDQGRGLGALAVEKLSNFGFTDLGLHRINFLVWSTNRRAIRTFEKAGFYREGLLREAAFVNERFDDVVVMGLING